MASFMPLAQPSNPSVPTIDYTDLISSILDDQGLILSYQSSILQHLAQVDMLLHVLLYVGSGLLVSLILYFFMNLFLKMK